MDDELNVAHTGVPLGVVMDDELNIAYTGVPLGAVLVLSTIALSIASMVTGAKPCENGLTSSLLIIGGKSITPVRYYVGTAQVLAKGEYAEP
jgi:hypothetical protein